MALDTVAGTAAGMALDTAEDTGEDTVAGTAGDMAVDTAVDTEHNCPSSATRGHKADFVQAAFAACMKNSYIDGSPWLKPPGTLLMAKYGFLWKGSRSIVCFSFKTVLFGTAAEYTFPQTIAIFGSYENTAENIYLQKITQSIDRYPTKKP